MPGVLAYVIPGFQRVGPGRMESDNQDNRQPGLSGFNFLCHTWLGC